MSHRGPAGPSTAGAVRIARKDSTMRLYRIPPLLLAALVLLPSAVRADAPAPWLPRYDLTLDLDLDHHVVRAHMPATWTNPLPRPTRQLVFNAHSHYFVPSKDVGLMAKTLEILRVNPSEALILKKPSCEVQKVSLVGDGPAGELPFHFEGTTDTTLVVDLPFDVGKDQSVTIALDFTLDLPQKQ